MKERALRPMRGEKASPRGGFWAGGGGHKSLTGAHRGKSHAPRRGENEGEVLKGTAGDDEAKRARICERADKDRSSSKSIKKEKRHESRREVVPFLRKEFRGREGEEKRVLGQRSRPEG